MGIPETDDSATLTTNVDSVSSQEEADSSTPEQKQTVDWEKRFKDTQAAYTKSQQELAKVKATLKVKETWQDEISAEDKDRLEDLKYSDPDAWYAERARLENESKSRFNEKLNQVTTELTELDKRELVLEEFKNSHPGFDLNDDIITYDVPKRITSKLENGDISWEEFLQETYDYLHTPKVIGDKNDKEESEPNLSEAGGGDTAADYATNADVKQSYKTAIF